MRRRSGQIGFVALLVALAVGVGSPAVIESASGAPTARVGGGQADATTRAHLPSPDQGRETRVPDFSRAGILRAEDSIVVANLTVPPGRYLVSYVFSGSLANTGVPAQLRCGLVDANGVDRFIAEDEAIITSGQGWQQMSVVTIFSLPDVTLGVRCEPTRTGLVFAQFRDVWLWAIRISD